MKRWLSIMLQVVASVGQIINLVEPWLSGNQKFSVAAALGIAQIVVNAIAHGSNPDGTPAKIAWKPQDRTTILE